MTCIRCPAAGRECHGCAGEDHVGGNISGPGLGISPGSPDKLQDLPQLLLTLGVQLVGSVQEPVGQLGDDAVKHGFPTEGQPLEFLAPDPHPQYGVNQDLQIEEPVSSLLGAGLHDLIRHAGHAHKLGEVKIEDGVGVAIYLAEIFPGNINIPNTFLRQVCQGLASEHITEFVHLVSSGDPSGLGSCCEPVPEDDKVLIGKPSKGGELDRARLGVQQFLDVEGSLVQGGGSTVLGQAGLHVLDTCICSRCVQ